MKEDSTEVDDDEFYDIYSLSMLRNLPLVVEPKINGTDIKMEVNTGASSSIINMDTHNAIKHKSDSLTYFKEVLYLRWNECHLSVCFETLMSLLQT